MFRIETVKRITEGGVYGLFTTTDIRRGQIVWRFNPMYDRLYSPAEYARFKRKEQDQIMFAGHLTPVGWVMDGGIDWFPNHSDEPNLIPKGYDILFKVEMLVAATRIPKGTELTMNKMLHIKQEGSK